LNHNCLSIILLRIQEFTILIVQKVGNCLTLRK